MSYQGPQPLVTVKTRPWSAHDMGGNPHDDLQSFEEKRDDRDFEEGTASQSATLREQNNSMPHLMGS